MSSFVYILRCGDGSLYTGWTNDLEARVKAHQEKRGAKYTRAQKLLLIAGKPEEDGSRK